ncbi:asparagine synthase (glutamine-hydrolyzing) [Lysinibacillus sp. 54212]|uniref:asparagine synthase (glutamine-hydrolyzing) n=1 Tax=Lysinibacillus sp. 54212 TaxID=3119829 RepID=UPI002FC68A1C
MCGITGWVDYQKDLRSSIAVIEGMTNVLAHRGPDDANIAVFNHALLGHRRLAVIDLAGGVQPMSKSVGQKRFTIVYNGELYNTEEIRQSLIANGYTFATTSDTEVLLTAYIEWGEACVQRLNGIFAFGVWDETEETLFLSRDRMGVKPLFYTEVAGGLLFSSELKSLLQHPDVSPVLNMTGLAALLSIGPSRIPGTGVYQNIKEVQPAHCLTVSRKGIKCWRYWDVKEKEHDHNEQETIQHVRVLLQNAVERQLVSDVPLCTFLSGGLDSSLLTAFAANHYAAQGKVLHTYSVDFEGSQQFFESNAFQKTQDGYWISLMQKAFQTEHHEIILSQQALIEALYEAVQLKDYPSMVDIDSSLLLLCREIKKDFTVALSGECADEVFGGYPWFFEGADQFPWIRSIHERQALLNDKWQRKLKLPEFMEAVYNDTISSIPKFSKGNETESKRQELFYVNNIFFMQTLLERKDRMSMGASLEVRVPFSDHRLVEYVWNIPWSLKTLGGQEKGILRKAAEGIVPDEIVNRKKNPYPKTYHPAYTNGVKLLLEDVLQQKSSILYELFQKAQLEELLATGGASFNKPWFGQLMAGPQLLAYFVQLHYWFENYHVQLVED